MMNLIWLVPLFPLAGFLFIGINYKHLPVRISGWIGSGLVLASFLVSLVIFIDLLNGAPSQSIILFDWIKAGGINFPVEFLIDPLSSLMLLIVTGVGFLIHVYSIGYMQDDEGFNRFFAYMNLFVFFMLVLVLGASYTIMFIGWEGVGLCSYLLIGFWFKNQDYNNAAKKAFIMNRIGDLGFLLGMFLLFQTFGSLSFSVIFPKAAVLVAGTPVLTTITLLLFVGAIGKSAQIPLFTWLPDAMAGPTPVSALIHAATMVTAGVYMVARSNILYALSPVTLMVVAIIGLGTALFAAVIAMFQNDIKKILAYSTISQLGYMFLGLGMGAFTGAVFHLTTHAFFKALLFLAAGSVIHALGGEQDIREMGGLSKKIPKTYFVFIVGTITIAGIPPFAGFFSKDEILAAVFAQSPGLWLLGVAGSMLTAFYMFRLLFLTFMGSFRGSNEKLLHIPEPPGTMMIPLFILAVLSAVGGFIGLPESMGPHSLKAFLEPVFAPSASHTQPHVLNSIEMGFILMGVTVTMALLMVALAWRLYVAKEQIPSDDEVEKTGVVRLIYNKFFIDEIYDFLLIRTMLWLSGIFHSVFELRIIDPAIESIGKFTIVSGRKLRLLQTGNVGFYLFAMVFGIILVLVFNVFGFSFIH
ncbi:MAG TPA: NADH-quinone oxidoreductase subunit L [Bacteroidales bacterium]